MPYEPLRLAPFDPNLGTIALTNYTYTNTDDVLAAIKTEGYFDKNLVSSDNFASVIKINDLITIQGLDGSEQLRVATVDPVIILTSLFPPPPQFTIINSFTAITLGGSAAETFSAPGLLPGDNVLATVGLTASVGTLVVERAGFASVDNITVVFNADPLVGSEVHILSVRFFIA